MTDIDFGTLVSAVVDELTYAVNEPSRTERKDPDAALEHYKRTVIGAIRTVFDEAENSAQVAPACSPTPAQGHDRAQKVDYSDPYVRALFSPIVIARLKKILAEEDKPPQLRGDLKL